MDIQLKSDTGFMPLPDLLQWLEQNRKSGNLLINCKEQGQAIYFEDGDIIFVSSCKEGQRLGDVLANTGFIERETVEASLEEARKFKVCFTQYLMDEQMLSCELLTEALTELAQMILIEILENEECVYTFTTPLHDIIRKGPIRITTTHLVMNSILKLDEQKRDQAEAETGTQAQEDL